MSRWFAPLAVALSLAGPALAQVPKPPADPKPADKPKTADKPKPADKADPLDPAVADLVEKLKSKDTQTRIRAAEALGEMGPAAAGARKPLCDAMKDLSGSVTVAALRAIEKVDPDLYKPLALVVLDPSTAKQCQGVLELGLLLGEKGEPAGYIVLTRMKAAMTARAALRPRTAAYNIHYEPLTNLIDASFIALRMIGSEDAEVLRVMKLLAAAGSPSAGVREKAIEFLAEWAGDKDDRRKQVAPLIRAGLKDIPRPYLCIAAAGRFGKAGKDCLPLLRQLKLSGDEETRRLATEAVDKIEKS